MATSSRRRAAVAFSERAIGLAWGAWAELGVSGWRRTHQNWAIDPEPLILFTAGLDDADPRLRDEATDWCIQNWRFVSRVRLRNLLGRMPDVEAAFSEFAATVNAHSPASWTTRRKPRSYEPSGRSILPPLERPSVVWLRMRAMFGLAARTEVLRYFLSHHPGDTVTLALLAEETGYTKRNVAEEADTLARSGLLQVRSTSNRFQYSLRRRSELEAFVGELPQVRPDWSALLHLVRELVDLEARIDRSTTRLIAVKASESIHRITDDLHRLNIAAPFDDVHGDDSWPALERVGHHLLDAWAVGEWPDPS